jgi:hypothetical protein
LSARTLSRRPVGAGVRVDDLARARVGGVVEVERAAGAGRRAEGAGGAQRDDVGEGLGGAPRLRGAHLGVAGEVLVGGEVALLPLLALLALRPLDALRSRGSGDPREALQTSQALRARRTGGTGRPGEACRPGRADRPARAGGAGRARRALRPGLPAQRGHLRLQQPHLRAHGPQLLLELGGAGRAHGLLRRHRLARVDGEQERAERGQQEMSNRAAHPPVIGRGRGPFSAASNLRPLAPRRRARAALSWPA